MKGKVVITDLTKVFQAGSENEKLVLEKINLTINPGEKLMLVGASGCGKSTALRMVAGLEKKTSGSITLDGQEITSPSRDLGVVFQQSTLFPWLTVKQNIFFSRSLRVNMFQSDKDISSAVYRGNALIELMGLEQSKHLYPSQISGGMQQRANIARALVSSPKVLLLDEPFSALDSQTRDVMHIITRHLFNIEKTTVIFVTHDVNEALKLGDRIIVLSTNPGRIDSEFVTKNLPRNFDGIPIPDHPEVIQMQKNIKSRITQTSSIVVSDELLQKVASKSLYPDVL
ncbi:ABC transporter ATP-binding protein [Acidithiobacillus albertensis]|uniref:ABC transporter ATP-binding protein n=1 Tax=Acidithiobacillus albertensis TaxID=119978 RepID=UPI00094B6E9E|nr:ABC transporter ATP-binding protein [Acidithiobacillus albertensis]